MTNLTQDKLFEVIFYMAESRGKKDPGRKPCDMFDESYIKQVTEYDVCKIPHTNKFFIKVFYKNSKQVFYLDIPASRVKDVMRVMVESAPVDPFDADIEAVKNNRQKTDTQIISENDKHEEENVWR
jgi:hypothetical protein